MDTNFGDATLRARHSSASRTLIPLMSLACTVLAVIALFHWRIDRGLSLDTIGPVAWAGDALSNYFYVKTALSTGWQFTNPSIAVPGKPELYLYPTLDLVWNTTVHISSLFARTNDPVVVSNYYAIVGSVINAAAFFLSARSLGVRNFICSVLSLNFAFIPFLDRAFTSHTLFPFPAAPIAAALAIHIIYAGKPRLAAVAPKPKTTSVLVTSLAVVAISASSVYWIAFSLIILAVATLGAGLSSRSLRAAVGGMCIQAAIIATTALIWSPVLVMIARSKVPIVAHRIPREQAYFGLRIPDLIFPTHTSIHFLRALTAHYRAWGTALSPDIYLGPLGVGGLAILFYVFFARLAAPGQPPLPQFRRPALLLLACCAVTLILFSVTNGFGMIFNFLVTPMLRAQERVAPFLAALCLLGIALIAESTVRSARFSQKMLALSAGVIAIVLLCIIDQTTHISVTMYPGARISYRSDQKFFGKLAEMLPPGSAIFDLPFAYFPEYGPVGRIDGYDLLRGYLLTRNLLWSHGATMDTPTAQWQQHVSNLPIARMIPTLVSSGFSAILIERGGYKDNGDDMIAQLQALNDSRLHVEIYPTRVIADLRGYYPVGADIVQIAKARRTVTYNEAIVPLAASTNTP